LGKRGKRKGPSLNKGIVLIIGIALGFALGLLAVRYGAMKGPTPEAPVAVKEGGATKKEAPSSGPKVPPAARVAILIDDMGGNLKRLREILQIDSPISIAVLPHLRHSRDVSRIAQMSGRDVLLHMPMEPKNIMANHPGKGVLLTDMSGTVIRQVILEDLHFVPEAVGVNNHMGSKFTENERGMREVFAVLKERGLFFVDSRTTAASKGRRLTREIGIPGAERDVFLDNKRDVEYINGQLETLVRIAMKGGSAVAIGHPYPETLDVLREKIPGLRRRGIEVVPVSELVR